MAKTIVFDTELLGDRFLFKGRVVENRNVITIWSNESDCTQKLRNVMSSGCTFVSFNGINFDMPIISAVIAGKSIKELKVIAKQIIENKITPWQIERNFGFKIISIDHIDLKEVAPGFVGLKSYGARMHMPWIKDLPFSPELNYLTEEEYKLVDIYCENDLDTTEELLNRLSFQLGLRKQLGEEYGIDLRSKSDAQMAESIFIKSLNLKRGSSVIPSSIGYTPPEYLSFESKELQNLLEKMKESVYFVEKSGHVKLPDFLEKEQITINNGHYKVGIGGIHSTHDKKVCHVADENTIIVDIDATSYYPSIWVHHGKKSGCYNEQLTDEYIKIYYRRLLAKSSGDKKTADGLKIPLNGSFGKLFSVHSALFAPRLGLFITLTGQLTLLMLIEKLEKIGAVTLSANTDGIVMQFSKHDYPNIQSVVNEFEKLTKFEFKYSEYRLLAMKDVNNYIAIKTDNKIKAKGIYAPPGLSKNPTSPVCAIAVSEWLKNGTPFMETIKNAPFIEFISARKVEGGGKQSDNYLGSVVRWYQTTEALPPIVYAANGNKVPKTDGAKPCMTIKNKLDKPTDIDYDCYHKEAIKIAVNIGCERFLTPEELAKIAFKVKSTKQKGAKNEQHQYSLGRF